MSAVIQTRGLTKYYGPVAGVVDLDLEVRRGEVFGYLGPNGAGKTTTLRLLMGLLKPTRGSARIFDLDMVTDSEAIRARVGYLPGEMRPYDQMTAGDYLEHLAGLRGLSGRRGTAHSKALAERLDLNLNRPIRQLSKGNRQKIGLVQAFMHRPELLLLDEPTSGLDPLMQRTFYELVREAQERGATVVLSSHVLAEVERITERVAVIRQGRLVVLEEMAALKARLPRRVVIEFDALPPLELFRGVAGVERVQRNGTVVTLKVRGPLGPVLTEIAGSEVRDLRTEEPQLEDVFMTYYEGSGGESGDGA